MGYGRCHCGCGQEVGRRTSRGRSKKAHLQVGDPLQYASGHQTYGRRKRPELYKVWEEKRRAYLEEGICPHCGTACDYLDLCHCGCGQQATIATMTRIDETFQHMKGLPYKRVKGHSNRKLSAEIARDIRGRYATDESLTLKALAEEFGVSEHTILKVMQFEVYKEAGIAKPESDTA